MLPVLLSVSLSHQNFHNEKTSFVHSLLCRFVFYYRTKNFLDQFKNWKPRNIGPAGMSGRITAIDVVIDNPATMYIGAASGGVWKTTNGGATWNILIGGTSHYLYSVFFANDSVGYIAGYTGTILRTTNRGVV